MVDINNNFVRKSNSISHDRICKEFDHEHFEYEQFEPDRFEWKAFEHDVFDAKSYEKPNKGL